MKAKFRKNTFIWKYRRFFIAIIIVFLIWFIFFSLPNPLFKKSTSTLLYSEDNRLLGASISSDEQWRFPAGDSIPKRFESCILQFEDAYFYKHPGVNLVSIFKALKQNITSRKIKSGGSTISMQTIRLAKENPKRTYGEKFLEILQALRLELGYSKKEILNLYVSNAPFGGNVVGLEAASWRYYAKPPHQLSWGESATLAVLPNAPALIFPGKNHELLLEKRNRLLKKLYEKEFLLEDDYLLAISEPLPLKPNPLPEISPHLLQNSILNHKGQKVHSTIDYDLQIQLNSIVENYSKEFSSREIHNMAVIVVETKSGNVKGYVGNTANANNIYSNQVDIIQASRSSGSILKPFLYASMLQEGSLLPKMLLNDIPTDITENYDKQYSGAVPADEALAKSLNVPAIHLLEKYGVAKFHHQLRELEFTTFIKNPKHYGLSLIVGGGEVKLWELAKAYRILGYLASQPKEEYFDSSIKYVSNEKLQKSKKYTISSEASYLTLKALQSVTRPDMEAGWQIFNSFPISWKTGTSHGFRDAWSVGVTPDYVVGVWVGNADGEGRPGIVGVKVAAPVMFSVFSKLSLTNQFKDLKGDLAKIKTCKESGYLFGQNCTAYVYQTVPKAANNAEVCPYHKIVHLDETETYRANSNCYPIEKIISKKYFTLPPIQEWYFKKNNPWYKSLPAFLPNCATTEERLFDFIYPKNRTHIFLPVNFEGKQQALIFEVAHKKPEEKLFWYLDGNYIGTTQFIHKMAFTPKEGSHKMVLNDERGASLEKHFKILSKNNM